MSRIKSMNKQCPIKKILLPVDGSEHSKRAVQFAGYLGASLGKNLTELALLRVVAGRYMSSYMPYVDLRADILKLSDSFKEFKKQHIEKNVKPTLDEGEKILRDLGIEVDIEKLIVEGDPAHEIIRIAEEKEFSTIIMARRGLSEIIEFLLGSITSKVVHAASRQTVYIVGHKILKDKKCPIPKVLIPVDGSSYSLRGAEHAACLATELKAYMSKITLLRVINIALYEKRIREGIDSEEEAEKILEEAEAVFLQAGVPERLITSKVRVGQPSEEILKEAEEADYNIIIMGRKGRAAIKDLILGGVSSTVLHRCQNPTIAIVSTEVEAG
jgi:nucleotide-binding universal stress UspA family protein